MTTVIALAIESTAKRTFASAIDWPGLARSGKTEIDAVAAILAHLDRYVDVATGAGEALPASDVLVEVVESGTGNATTEFGAPGRIAAVDHRPTSQAGAERLARLVGAAWEHLDATVTAAPESLRKGPRGGGRDTSKIAEHALMADHAYARELGLRLPVPTLGDRGSVRLLREAMLAVLRQPSSGQPLAGRKWTARHAAHRIAWHTLDHAWEIEDRSDPT